MTDEELKQALKSEILNFDSKNLTEEQIINIACEIGYKRIQPVALELSGNKISLNAMEYVTRAVSRCPSLIYLSFIGCDLNDESIYLIAKHLSNHPLLSLILMNNKITEQGEIILSDMLAHNKHILEFNAQGNLMNMSTSIDSLFNTNVSFAEAAKKNTTLISFAIEANKIPARYREAIEERIFENRNRFEEEVMPDIRRISKYKIPESLVNHLKSYLLRCSKISLSTHPLLVIVEQQKMLQLMKEAENKATLAPVLFSAKKQQNTSKISEQEQENINPNKLAASLKTLTF